MKKFLLSMVALAALAACEKNNDAPPDFDNGTPKSRNDE